MKKIVSSDKPKINFRSSRFGKSELVGFVEDQFRKLAKKNLRVPITLYHL